MKEWLTWSNAKKFYIALAGAVAVVATTYADIGWLASIASVLTAGAVWLAKNGTSTTGS